MITDHIMLGAKEDAENAAMLLEFGVTHVLNTAQQLPNYFPQNFVYLKLSLIGKSQMLSLRAAVHSILLSCISLLHGRCDKHKLGRCAGERGELPEPRGEPQRPGAHPLPRWYAYACALRSV